MSDETIITPPTDDTYPLVSTLFVKKRFKKFDILVNGLSLTILDLINQGQIKCEINWEKSHIIGKELTPTDLDVMKNITLRIINKGELKTSESLAIKLLKTMTKNKKFTLKDMLKQGKSSTIANKFENDFIEFRTALENENNYTPKEYKDILANGKLTKRGKELQKDWTNFEKYLKSPELTEKYPPKSIEENTSQIIYGACFNIEREVLELRENNSILCDLIDKDGYKLLNIIFNNTLSNVSEKRRGNGVFYGVNDKYTIPGA